jgi:ABC-type multidrug transport system fused ATPase/permease subunit
MPYTYIYICIILHLTEWLAAAFGLLAVADIVAQYFQTYLFEVIGERMTRRIRTDYFRSLLRQDMGWFDDPANALGVLTSRLAVDIKLIRLTVGQGTGSTVSSLTALLAGFIIALIAAWQFALAFLATMPLLAMTEAINWALMKGGDSASKKVSCERICF